MREINSLEVKNVDGAALPVVYAVAKIVIGTGGILSGAYGLGKWYGNKVL